MNERILELIKNPETLSEADLKILEQEIQKQPYVQNFRALYLLGTHKHHQENYQKELSITAAYTTDKKILYRFINKTEEKSAIPEVSEKILGQSSVQNASKTLSVPQNDEQTASILDEEKNIEEKLPVEENLSSNLNQDSSSPLQTFDNEYLINDFSEKSKDVEELSETKEEVDSEIEEAENFSTEEIVTVKDEALNLENSAELSFHGVDDFLPKIDFSGKVTKLENYEIPKADSSKKQDEMQRLIAEVEAKMKAKKSLRIVEDEPQQNFDINFVETHDFHFIDKAASVEIKNNVEDTVVEKPDSSSEKENTETTLEKIYDWKPLNFLPNLPDSILSKNESDLDNSTLPHSVHQENNAENIEQPKSVEIMEDRPVFNVSFFNPTVAPIEPEPIELSVEKDIENQNVKVESNIPQFINTWQSWLKLDKKSQTEAEKISEQKEDLLKEEIKAKAIETFIENEPKITKLKEDLQYTVKEKGDNISHLMTETLAKLYVEQKLYAKAIKAYEILKEKHPEKETEFDEKINSIKDLRQNPK